MSKPLGRRVGLLLCTALLCACTTTQTAQARPRTGEMAGMLPVLSVERFLQAANERDFDGMRELFGTFEGPIDGERRELELRMAAIAEVLRHDDYRVTGDQREPGREHPTTRVTVTITKGGRQISDVPFFVVQTQQGGWLVEQVDLEKITR
jgi:hypothetical protein